LARPDRSAQFQQIVVNLAVNARDAMPHGGRLMIRTRNRIVEDPRTAYGVEVEPGQYVSLTVTDTGTGMTTEAMTHAFEPFFTTKPKGQGTGLGLATCHGIVKQHDGHIFVSSAPGEGTTFDLLFPRARHRLEVAAAPEPQSRPSEGCETVLLAEDEAMVLDLAARCLSSRGYRVLRARDGDEALRVASEHDGTIHLLVTDVIMPRLSGPDCAERLCRARPDLRVLFTSGYTDDAIGQHGVLDGDVEFLQKPYSPDELADRVRRVLDEARTASKRAR
jgi:CheY-like chemotaxis protein